MRKLLLFPACVVLASCAAQKTVRQVDLDAWVGQPVQALDTHSLFLTIPMRKSIADDGTEVRVYSNTVTQDSCSAGGGMIGSNNSLGYANCVSSKVGCNNIFYIKDRKVLEFKPVGQCFTDETAQPERRTMRSP